MEMLCNLRHVIGLTSSDSVVVGLLDTGLLNWYQRDKGSKGLKDLKTLSYE